MNFPVQEYHVFPILCSLASTALPFISAYCWHMARGKFDLLVQFAALEVDRRNKKQNASVGRVSLPQLHTELLRSFVVTVRVFPVSQLSQGSERNYDDVVVRRDRGHRLLHLGRQCCLQHPDVVNDHFRSSNCKTSSENA